jgi:predicted transcriptional regulator of viral defense system
MNAATAIGILRRLRVPVVRTVDAAAALDLSGAAASKVLCRLQDAGVIEAIRKGLWWIENGAIDRYGLPEQLTAPFPSYVSLTSALQVHGLIEQVPEQTYVVSLARRQKIATCVGTYSVHHVAPEVFGGCADKDGFKIATAEKALFDVAYLSRDASRTFARLPELTVPRGFRRKELTHWLGRIADPRRRALTEESLEGFLARAQRG